MARILGLRRPRPIPEVESQIAHLEEELSLTAAFVAAMERRGEHRAALGAIEEQRTRLAQAERVMVRELAKPRKHRVQAAIAGVAAVLTFASASFAGYRAFGPEKHSQETIIRSASVKLAEAASAQDPSRVAAIVDQVNQSLSTLEADALNDSETRENVQSILEQQMRLLTQRVPNSAVLVQRVQSVANDLKVTVETPSPPPAPKPEAPEQPNPSAPAAPQP